MTTIFDVAQIKEAVQHLNPIQAIEEGFVAYSQGKAVVPPVGELLFEDPPGDTHIKYGYIIGDEYFVIKVASGFYENSKLNLPTNSGLMLLFSQKTGVLVSLLLDEGYLTDVRTAAAGAVVAKYLAPKQVHRIGVFGSRIQGRMQVQFLASVVACREVIVWGRTQSRLKDYQHEMEALGYHVETTQDARAVAGSCNLIVTATPAKAPLLQVDDIQPGTHITAMGSDTSEKIELDPRILQRADRVVADSLSQCLERGEIHHAVNAGLLNKDNIVELGHVIVNPALRRTSDDQVTVADLTGVAVQDIQISKAVYHALRA